MFPNVIYTSTERCTESEFSIRCHNLIKVLSQKEKLVDSNKLVYKIFEVY